MQREEQKAKTSALVSSTICLLLPICQDTPRTRQQFVAGVAANAVNENALTKLMFIKSPKGQSGYPQEFRQAWDKPGGFIFGRKVFTQLGYEQYLEKKGA